LIYVKDSSTLIFGNNLKCKINNSNFQNVNLRNLDPVIDKSKYSYFLIENSTFNDIT